MKFKTILIIVGAYLAFAYLDKTNAWGILPTSLNIFTLTA